MKQRPTILISNDDGIGADGIIALAEEIKKFANIIVVAPHTQQSAVGHSITMANPIRATKTYVNKKFFGYSCGKICKFISRFCFSINYLQRLLQIGIVDLFIGVRQKMRFGSCEFGQF